MTLSWTSETGKVYTILSKGDLSDPWANEEPGIVGDGSTITRTYVSDTGNKFFAIVCNNAP